METALGEINIGAEEDGAESGPLSKTKGYVTELVPFQIHAV